MAGQRWPGMVQPTVAPAWALDHQPRRPERQSAEQTHPHLTGLLVAGSYLDSLLILLVTACPSRPTFGQKFKFWS